MFLDHFGIEENPFSNTPDPNYLFMSERHQEALAHLQYGVQGSSGFVLLTGEVGTGKTTICRYLVEQLPENVDLAMCLNPRLSEAELLATICDELAINVKKCAPGSVKDHMDALNKHLLKVHANGRRAVLIIDEAQNLTPSLLEQVRLLTNLETASTKLLQIILVGQPELREILATTELRQLSQRITARYHLDPMTRPEAEQYIRHRLKIGKLTADTIQPGAMAEIYARSAGIPRLINSICERSMLGAFAMGVTRIDGPLARTAATEVLGETPPPRAPRQNTRTLNWAVGTTLSAAILFGTAALSLRDRDAALNREPVAALAAAPATVASLAAAARPLPGKAPPPRQSHPPAAEQAAPAVSPAEQAKAESAAATVTQSDTESEESKVVARLIAAGLVTSAKAPRLDPPTPETPSSGTAATATDTATDTVVAAKTPAAKDAEPGTGAGVKPGADEKITLENLFRRSDLKGGLGTAITRLFSLWNRETRGLSGLDPCADAEKLGLKCFQHNGSWTKMATINRPALITLVNADGRRKYGVVSAIGDSKITLDIDGREIIAEADDIRPLWPGDFLVLWKPLPRLGRNLRSGMTGKDVAWLRDRLREILGKASPGRGQGGNGQGDNKKTGLFDDDLKKQVIAFQESRNLAADGIVGTMTQIQLSAALAPDSVPVLRRQQQ